MSDALEVAFEWDAKKDVWSINIDGHPVIRLKKELGTHNDIQLYLKSLATEEQKTEFLFGFASGVQYAMALVQSEMPEHI